MAISQTEREALLELKSQGYSFAEATAFIGGQRLNKDTVVSRDIKKKEVVETAQEPNLQERLAEVGSSTAEAFREGTSGSGSFLGDVRGGTEAVAALATAVPRGALALAPEPVRKGVEVAGEKIGAGFEKVTDFLSETRPIQEIKERTEQGGATEQVLGTLGAAGEIAGTIAGAEGVVGTLGRTTTLAKTGLNAIKEADLELKGINLPSTEGITKAIDLGLKPEDIMQRVARVSKGKQAKFEKTAGESVGTYLVNRDIFGTSDQIVDQLWNRVNASKANLDRGLSQVRGTYKSPDFKDAMDQLAKREEAIGGVGRVTEQGARVTELAKKHKNQGLTLTEMNEVKRLYERNVKLDFLKDFNPTGVAKSNNVDQGMREFIVDRASKGGFDNVTDLNKETQLAFQLVDDLGAEFAGSAGNNAIGLTDAIFLAEATTGNISSAIAAGVKIGLSSKPVQSAVAKLMAKNAGSKAELPSARVTQPDPNKLSDFVQFLENQANRASQ